MVYKLFNEGIEGFEGRKQVGGYCATKANNGQQRSKQKQKHQSVPIANSLIYFIRILLFIYDAISLPIYFILQRPDRRAKEAQRIRSERVDINTWIKTDQNPNETSYLLNGGGQSNHCFGAIRWLINQTIGYSSAYNHSKPDNNNNNNNSKRIQPTSYCERPKRHKYLGSTLNEIFANAIQEFGPRPCLGYRAVVTCPVLTLNEEGKNILQDKSFRSDYTWYTYEQIGRRVQDIASGLYYHSVFPGSRALFLAETSLEWFCASQACFQLAAQLVIAPEINDLTTLKSIVEDSEISIIFASCDRLNQLCELFERIKYDEPKYTANINANHQSSNLIHHIKTVVLIDWQFQVDFSEPAFARLRDSSEHIVDETLSIGQIEEAGVENPIELSCTRPLNSSATEAANFDILTNTTTTTTNLNENNQQQKTSNKLKRTAPVAPSTVPLRRRSLMTPAMPPMGTRQQEPETNNGTNASNSSSISGRIKKISLLGQRPLFVDLPLLKSSATSNYYTITDQHELDLKSSSPRLSIDSRGSDLSSSCALSSTFRGFNSEMAPKSSDLAMIVYTHGSLGQIKALMLTHSYLSRSNHYLFLDGMVNGKDIHCTTLSLDNVIEFMTEMCVFSHGGSIGYSSSQNTLFYDGKELFKRDRSDLEALQPTFLLVRPYILERLRSSVQNYLSLQWNPLMSFVLTNVLYDYKKYWARRHFETPIVNRLFCSELKKLFGGNLKYILCNGATDCSETKDFFAFMVNIPVTELYGPDEAIVSLISVNDIWDYKRRRKRGRYHHNHHKSKATANSSTSGISWLLFGAANTNELNRDQEDDQETGLEEDFRGMQLLPPIMSSNTFRVDNSKNLLITSSILCPTLGTRIRLEDWEDFRTSDQPYPRGRLVIGGEVVCKGYYRRRELTSKSFYLDSNLITWFRTDDIARVFPNGSFEIISGMSDMIKMVDGQFISLSQIEHILRNSQFVDNVCAICGDDRKFVIALVVPNLRRLALKSPGEANLKMAIGMEPEPEELIDIDFRREVCNDRLLCEFVSKHLSELIAKVGFQAIPSRFHLVPEIWTPESELVTPSFEPKRGAIQKFYAADIQSIIKMEFRDKRNRLSARKFRTSSGRFSNTHHNSSGCLDQAGGYNLQVGGRLSY